MSDLDILSPASLFQLLLILRMMPAAHLVSDHKLIARRE